MIVYYYIVPFDTGFTPNPFWGYCTLACCKPKIRKSAQKGHWVVGVSQKKAGNRLTYAMEITEYPLLFRRYFEDKRFSAKKPDTTRKAHVHHVGDNMYSPKGEAGFSPLPSPHHDCTNMATDLGGEFVLASRRFWYFGSAAKELPPELKCLVRDRQGHGTARDREMLEALKTWLGQFPQDIHAAPTLWPQGDESWKEGPPVSDLECDVGGVKGRYG